MEDSCPICGERFPGSPLSEKLGLSVWRCPLCDALFAAGFAFVVLSGALVYSFAKEPWAWIVALLCLGCGIYLLDRSSRRRK